MSEETRVNEKPQTNKYVLNYVGHNYIFFFLKISLQSFFFP